MTIGIVWVLMQVEVRDVQIIRVLLGSFSKLRKATIIFAMSVCLSVRPSLRRHGTTRLTLDGF